MYLLTVSTIWWWSLRFILENNLSESINAMRCETSPVSAMPCSFSFSIWQTIQIHYLKIFAFKRKRNINTGIEWKLQTNFLHSSHWWFPIQTWFWKHRFYLKKFVPSLIREHTSVQFSYIFEIFATFGVHILLVFSVFRSAAVFGEQWAHLCRRKSIKKSKNKTGY